MLLIVAVCLWFAALLLGPIFGLYLTAKWNVDPTGRRTACLYAAGLIGSVSFSWVVGLQTVWATINLLFCVSAFLAYWVLAGAVGTVRPRIVGYLLGMTAYIPAIPSVLLGTVGMLGSAFILSEYLSPPLAERRLDAGLSCRVMAWGMVLTDEGYTVHLSRSLPWFPLRLEVATVSVDETDARGGPTSATCESVATAWRGGER